MIVLAVFVMFVLGLVSVLMRFLVFVFVLVAVAVLMVVPMSGLMLVPMIMLLRMPMVMLGIHLLRKRIVLGKGFVVAMLMTAAVRASLRMKRRVHHFDPHANTLQHIPQHGIDFKLQITVAEFDRRMPIPKVISGPHQLRGARSGNAHQRFGRGHHTDQRAIVGDQDIAFGQHSTARHQQRHRLAIIEVSCEPALASRFIRQRQRNSPRHQRTRELDVTTDTLVDFAHSRSHQNRK